MSVDFIDSNVFVYLFDDKDDRKRGIAEAIVEDALANGSGTISFQVVQETVNVLTRKLGAPPEDARRLIDAVLTPLWSISPTPGLYRNAVSIHGRLGFSFYDSLIVAAAQEAGCARILTEDLQDGQRIGGVSIVDPFRA